MFCNLVFEDRLEDFAADRREGDEYFLCRSGSVGFVSTYEYVLCRSGSAGFAFAYNYVLWGSGSAGFASAQRMFYADLDQLGSHPHTDGGSAYLRGKNLADPNLDPKFFLNELNIFSNGTGTYLGTVLLLLLTNKGKKCSHFMYRHPYRYGIFLKIFLTHL